jgi:hypothetical protein
MHFYNLGLLTIYLTKVLTEELLLVGFNILFTRHRVG